MSQKTAIIYARVSTVRQADDGLPVESQIDGGYRKAEALVSDVLKVFRDDGISGRTDERPGFRAAIAYCRTRKVDYFICWSTSRFARNKLDAALYKKELKKCGCRVVYVSVDLDNETDSGWMMESMLEIFDEHYSRQVSVDTLRSMMKNARDGFWNGGRVPFGFHAVSCGRRKRLAALDEEVSTVREVFAMYLRGFGCKVIAQQLNERGRFIRGKRWGKNTVAWVLKNWAYAGYTVFNRKDTVTGRERPRSEWVKTQSHDPIIEEEVFMRVQDILGGRTPVEGNSSARSQHVFTGMLRCGCGAAMTTESANGNGGRYSYYNCTAAQKGSGCAHRRIRADWFDEWMFESIMDRILTRDRLVDILGELHQLAGEWVKERARRRESIAAELRDTEKRLHKLYDILELHGKEAPNLGDLTERMRDLKKRRDTLESDLVKLEEAAYPAADINESDIAETAEMLRDIVLSGRTPSKLRAFFNGFIKEIVLEDQDVKIEYRPELLVNRAGFDTVRSSENWLPELGLSRTKVIRFQLSAKFHRKRFAA